jgi:hypothetical protein
MKSGIKKDKSTEEKALFWSSIEESACQRDGWPSWKRGFLSSTRARSSETRVAGRDSNAGSSSSSTESRDKRRGR